MHPYEVPASVKDHVVNRMGKLLAHDTIAAAHAALVVVDMQNYFCASGFPGEVPMSQSTAGVQCGSVIATPSHCSTYTC